MLYITKMLCFTDDVKRWVPRSQWSRPFVVSTKCAWRDTP